MESIHEPFHHNSMQTSLFKSSDVYINLDSLLVFVVVCVFVFCSSIREQLERVLATTALFLDVQKT